MHCLLRKIETSSLLPVKVKMLKESVIQTSTSNHGKLPRESTPSAKNIQIATDLGTSRCILNIVFLISLNLYFVFSLFHDFICELFLLVSFLMKFPFG